MALAVTTLTSSCGGGGGYPVVQSNDFITTWKVTTEGLTLEISFTVVGDFTVDWGDGKSNNDRYNWKVIKIYL